MTSKSQSNCQNSELNNRRSKRQKSTTDDTTRNETSSQKLRANVVTILDQILAKKITSLEPDRGPLLWRNCPPPTASTFRRLQVPLASAVSLQRREVRQLRRRPLRHRRRHSKPRHAFVLKYKFLSIRIKRTFKQC